MRAHLACAFLFFVFMSIPAVAQVPDPVIAAQAPQPSSAHHYIGAGTETVNPADGSVSFDLPIQLPAGRGFTVPFGIRYGGPETWTITNNASGGNLFWQTWSGQTWLQFNGWSYSVPSLRGMIRVVAEAYNPSTQQTSVCLGAGNFVFRGLDGVQRTLQVGDVYVDPQNNHLQGFCGYAIQSSSNLHGVVASTPTLSQWQNNFPAQPPVTATDQSGTVYAFPQAPGVQGVSPSGTNLYSFGLAAQTITDHNGNQMYLKNSNQSLNNGYVDQLGRNTVVSWTGIVSVNRRPS